MEYLLCPRCSTQIPAQSRFCNSCGLPLTGHAVAQSVMQRPRQPHASVSPRKKSIGLGVTAGIALLSVLGVCGLCGLAGSLTGPPANRKPVVEDVNRPISSTPSNALPANATPAKPPSFAELKSKGDKLLKQEKGDFDTRGFDEVSEALDQIPKDSKDYAEAQTLKKKLGQKGATILAEKLVLGPKPINSAWDGSVREADHYLREVLNDYHNSEYLGWTQVALVYQKKEPYWVTTGRIRAKNAFGAYIVKDVTFYIRGGQVIKTKGL